MRDTLTIGKNTDQQYSSVFFERALDADFLLFTDIREDAKQFQSVDIFCVGKSPQTCWHVSKPTLQQTLKLMLKIPGNDGS